MTAKLVDNLKTSQTTQYNTISKLKCIVSFSTKYIAAVDTRVLIFRAKCQILQDHPQGLSPLTSLVHQLKDESDSHESALFKLSSCY